MEQGNDDYSAHTEYSPYQYVPRRDLPTSSYSKPLQDEEFTIIDREPGDDCVPRYILRRNTRESDYNSYPLLRVTLFDIEDFVSKREIHRFENSWFAHGNPDFSSQKEWHKAIKSAKATGAYVFKRSPNINVVVYQDKSLLERNSDLTHRTHLSPAQRPFSLPVEITSLPRSTSELSQNKDENSDADQLSEQQGVEEYEVSRVLNHKDVLGVLYYLVTWAGFPENDATWLTEEELVNAREAIDEYFRALTAEASETGHHWLGDRLTGDLATNSEPDRVHVSRQNPIM